MKKQLLLAAAALALSGAASAQNYGVLGVGRSSHDLDCAGASTCDENGTAFKLVFGHKYTPNLALEVGYMNFGKARAAETGVGSLSTKVDGFGVGGAFHTDFAPNWNFVARLGLAQMKAKGDATVVGLGSASDSDSSAQLYGGLGVGYRLTKQMTLGAHWDFTRAKLAGEKLDVNAYSMALTFDF